MYNQKMEKITLSRGLGWAEKLNCRFTKIGKQKRLLILGKRGDLARAK